MNHLAHAHLAQAHPHGQDYPDFLAGSVLGDFCKGLITADDWPGKLAAGIRFHRQIDGFTDRHPLTRECRTHFPAEWRRLSGPALDVIWDYFLSQQWQHWHAGALATFAASSCNTLLRFCEHFPRRATPFSYWLAQEHILESYATPAGVEAALSLTVHRLPGSEGLATVARQWLETHETWLESRFHLLYADCLEHTTVTPCLP